MRRLLFLVLVVALALRLAHLDFGLHLSDLSATVLNNQQDEEGMARALLVGSPAGKFEWLPAGDGLLRGGLHPGIFMLWGSCGYYVFGLADLVVVAALAPFEEGGRQALLARLESNPSLLHLVHRAVSALAGFAAVLLVWRIGRRLGRDACEARRLGLLSAALAAVAYLPVRESHFGTLDMLAALFVVAAVERSLALIAAPTLRTHLLAGAWTGLAAATKYFGGTVALVVFVAHLAARRAARDAAHAGSARPATTRLLAAGAAAAAAFVLVSPQVWWTPAAFFGALAHQRDTIGIGLADSSWLAELAAHHLRFTFRAGWGETACIATLVGAVAAWRRGGAARALVLSAVLLLPMFFIARSPAVRYGIAHVLLFCPLAALAMLGLARVVARRSKLKLSLAVALLAALVALPSALRTLSFLHLIGQPDTRLDARAWLAELGATHENTWAFGFGGLPRAGFMTREELPWTDALRGIWSGRLPADPRGVPRPQWILRDETAGSAGLWSWGGWFPVLEAEYRQVQRLDPRRDPQAVNLPDKAAGTPTFFVPFTNPWAQARPGPVLTLFERREPAPR